MAINFENRVVLVTGGTRGLGREFSLCLGANGATVAVNSTTSDDAGVIDTITGSGGQAAHFAGLVEHPDPLIEAVIERFGRLDAIIHNAGFVRDKTLRKMTDEQWQEVIDVHLSAAFKLTRAAWPHFEAAGGGRIVFISSASGLYGNFGQSNYAAAKMGMYGLARSISMEGGRANITCNCVAPVGATTMNSGHWSDRDKDIRKAEYVAPLVAYLAHSSCEESGSFFETSAGSYKKLRWERTEGLNLFPTNTPVTIDTIAENWQTITNFESTEHPQSMADSLQRMYARFDD